MQLVRLDQVLGLPACAIDLVVSVLGRPGRLVTMKRLSAPLGAGLDAGDDAALDVPAFGGIAELAIAADLLRLAGEATQSGVVGERTDLAQQHRVAGQPEDEADAPALAPRHRVGAAVMAVAAHDDLDCRPADANTADDVAQDQSHLGPVRRLAGAQDDGDGLARRRLVMWIGRKQRLS